MPQQQRHTGSRLSLARARARRPLAHASVILALAALSACGLRVEGGEIVFVGSGGGGRELPDAHEPEDAHEHEDAEGHEDAHHGGPDSASDATSPGPDAAGSDACNASDGAVADGGEKDASDATADRRTGKVDIKATIEYETVGAPHYCPGITSFSVSPAALAPGQAASLGVVTTGPPAAILWTALPVEGGAFSDPAGRMPTFVCAHPGTVTVTVTASLPNDGGTCIGVRFTSYSAPINCLPN